MIPKLTSAVQMSKYPQNTMHAKIMYGWTNRGRTDTNHTFAPVDLTAPKVAAGKNGAQLQNVISSAPLTSPQVVR